MFIEKVTGGYFRCLYLASIIFILGSCTSHVKSNLDPKEATAELKTLLESESFKDTDKIRGLIKAGADVNAVNNKGETSLDIALKEGHENIVNLLKNMELKNEIWSPPLMGRTNQPSLGEGYRSQSDRIKKEDQS